MSEKKSTDQVEDQELNDLLESALQDFNKEPAPETEISDSSKSDITVENTTDESVDDVWAKDFMKHAAFEYDEHYQRLMQDGLDTELAASFQKMAQSMAEAISKTEDSEGDVTTDFRSAINKALSDLSTNSENLQNEPDLSELLAQTSLEKAAGGILPFMQGMLHELLSKEMLYPPLKEFVDKYPDWLDEKRESLSEDEVEKYTKQLQLLRKVCGELEKEREDDTEEIKEKRFVAIVSLMEEAQNCGRLPEELVGDQPNPFQVDGDHEGIIASVLRGGDVSQNCSIM